MICFQGHPMLSVPDNYTYVAIFNSGIVFNLQSGLSMKSAGELDFLSSLIHNFPQM